MTRQEKFSIARKNLQKSFTTLLSYEIESKGNTYIASIFLNNIIISVGTYDYKEEENLSTNDRYLESMITAIANYDPALIPK